MDVVVKVLVKPFPSTYIAGVFYASVAALSLFYYACAIWWIGRREGGDIRGKVVKGSPEAAMRSKRLRERSWILTGGASSVMTLVSLPFVSDLVLAGGDVAKVHRREWLAQAGATFFVAYLVTDIVLGLVHYRAQVSMLTGWIHHTAYTALVLHVLNANFPHVFLVAAFMELPTAVLALSMLVPAARSDLVFTSLFFLIRIAYHLVLIALYAHPHGRTHGTSLFSSSGDPLPNLVPVLALIAAVPLHIMWFTASLRGLLKRRRAIKAIAEVQPTLPPTEPTKVPEPPSPYLLPARPRLSAIATSYLRLPSPRRTGQQRVPQIKLREYIQPLVGFDLRLPPLPRLQNGLAVTGQDAAGQREEEDVLRALESPLVRARMRAGLGGDEIKRFGGRIRRRVLGGVQAQLIVA